MGQGRIFTTEATEGTEQAGQRACGCLRKYHAQQKGEETEGGGDGGDSVDGSNSTAAVSGALGAEPIGLECRARWFYGPPAGVTNAPINEFGIWRFLTAGFATHGREYTRAPYHTAQFLRRFTSASPHRHSAEKSDYEW
jgi:hypothetical protein